MNAFMVKFNEYYKLQYEKDHICENEKICECGCEFQTIENQIICTNCGITKGYTFINFGEIIKKKYMYNKCQYFALFLQRIQGFGNFNEKRYETKLKEMFGTIKRKITKDEIKEILWKHKMSKPLLRYLPDIYYYVTGEKPTQLPQQIAMKMIDRYRQVIQHEKYTKIKLPSAKKYFSYRFIKELPSEYHTLLFFMNPINCSKVYDEIYEKIFDKSIHVNRK